MRMQDTEAGTVDEDWEVLLSFLPQDWRELAQDTGALKGLRKDKTVDNLLRTLLLHLGCGHSLRETVVRARQAHLADLSDVALLKRLKKSKGWLHALWCARQTGEGWPVKVRRKEGVTNHLHPESCAGRCEAAGEALTGARTGRAIEHRKRGGLERRDYHSGRRPHRHHRAG